MRQTPSVPLKSAIPLVPLTPPAQLRSEPSPVLFSPSAWLDPAASSAPQGGQQPVPSAGQAPVPALRATTPASLPNRPLEHGFKEGDPVVICNCGVESFNGCPGVLGPLEVDLAMWTVHVAGGWTVRCDVNQLRSRSDLQQADAGAGNAGARPSSLAGGDRPSDPAPVAMPRSSQQPCSSQQLVAKSVRLIAPSGKTRDLHLCIQMTVQDILKNHLPSELGGQNNVAIFNTSGNKIEPNLTIGDLARQSEQLVLQLLTDDW